MLPKGPIMLNIVIPPAPPKMEWGCTWFTPMSVCPSVHPSVDKVSGTFWKKISAQFISYLAFTLMGWVFDPQPHFPPSGGQIFGRKWGFWNFFKNLLAQFISYLAFILMGWVSWPLYVFVFLASYSALWWPNIWPKMGFPEIFEKNIDSIHYVPGIYTLRGWFSWPLFIFVFLASFSALWWPNIWPQMGFLELFEKTIGSFHFIHGIYPNGVSLLTPIHFRVPSLIFGPLVAKYLVENSVSGTFWKTIGSIHYIPGIYPYGVSLLTPIHLWNSLLVVVLPMWQVMLSFACCCTAQSAGNI